MSKGLHLKSVRQCLPIRTKILDTNQIAAKPPNTKFHENLNSGSRDASYEQTDGQRM